jgi:dTDP-4-dehydrorhamnose reductase
LNILIIGGAGYIGSHVAREMLDQGQRVTVYDNLSSGLKANLFPEEEFIQGDILDYPGLIRAAKGGFDALIHLAAFKAAGESMLKPEKYSVNNITGTLNILNAAAEAGIKHIVFSSSAAVYGEPEYLPIDERHPCRPENYYGFTKLEIERFLGWYERLKGIRFAALRYFNAAGYDVKGRITGLERNPANLIPVVMEEAAAGMRSEVQVFGNDYPTPDGTGMLVKLFMDAVPSDRRSADHCFGKWGLKLPGRWATLEEASADPRLLTRPPNQAADLPMHFSTSRKWYELPFSLADLRLEVYATVCWQTPRNQDGPYCPLVSRIIA